MLKYRAFLVGVPDAGTLSAREIRHGRATGAKKARRMGGQAFFEGSLSNLHLVG
jgi:hypothetical protein